MLYVWQMRPLLWKSVTPPYSFPYTPSEFTFHKQGWCCFCRSNSKSFEISRWLELITTECHWNNTFSRAIWKEVVVANLQCRRDKNRLALKSGQCKNKLEFKASPPGITLCRLWRQNNLYFSARNSFRKGFSTERSVLVPTAKRERKGLWGRQGWITSAHVRDFMARAGANATAWAPL